MHNIPVGIPHPRRHILSRGAIGFTCMEINAIGSYFLVLTVFSDLIIAVSLVYSFLYYYLSLAICLAV